MAKKLSSNSRKHKNAVVVCSIIGRKAIEISPVFHSSDRIQDTEGNGLDFKSLSEFFLKNKPFCPGYEESDVRKKKTIKISVIEYDTLKKDLKDIESKLKPINNKYHDKNKDCFYMKSKLSLSNKEKEEEYKKLKNKKNFLNMEKHNYLLNLNEINNKKSFNLQMYNKKKRIQS